MALALVAGATASVVIEKLIRTAVSYVQECGAGTSAMQDEIQRLQQASLRILTILDLVERGQRLSARNKTRGWTPGCGNSETLSIRWSTYYELEKAAQAGDNKVQQGECLRIEGDGSGDIPKTIRHIYVNRVNPLMISHLKSLRTLIIHLNRDDVVAINEVLTRLKSLRLLHATGDYLCKLNLRSLRQLQIDDASLLQSIPELPASMKSLRISCCLPKLEEYIEGSGKFANIPCVTVYEEPSRRPIITRIRRR